MSQQWRQCEGRWARFLRYLCHHGPWQARIRQYVIERVQQEIEEERMQAVLGACWQNRAPVIGTVDEDGALHLTILEEPEAP